jgi:hypothetical protein
MDNTIPVAPSRVTGDHCHGISILGDSLQNEAYLGGKNAIHFPNDWSVTEVIGDTVVGRKKEWINGGMG